jgi:citrate lyase beta subunit
MQILPSRSLRPRRSFFEVPIMEERKWSKVPQIAADVFMLDMEDSCPPGLKEAARARIVDLIAAPAYLGGREFIVRPNNLDTPWGRADLEALAAARAPFIIYPKVREAAEIHTILEIFARHYHQPEIMLIIETPQAVLRLEQIAGCPGVSTLLMGPGDLAMETGIEMFEGPDLFADGFLYARGKVVMAAKAFGLQPADAVFTADLKDEAAVRRSAALSRKMGFTGLLTFYPPHVPIINAVMSPAPEAIEAASRLVAAYDEGRARGLAAITVDGKWATIHQYTAAQRLLAQAAALEPGA